MKTNPDIAPTWTFEKRLALDRAEHKLRCKYCRQPKSEKLKSDEILYGVKNKVTREYLHVVAKNADEARSKLGWTFEDTYALILEMGNKSGAPMSEETKLRLRAIAKERRDLRRPDRPPSTPKRHQHVCPECKKKYMHTDKKCGSSEERICVVCETDEGVLTDVADRGTMPDVAVVAVDKGKQEGGDIMVQDLKTFVREFIESQVIVEDKDGKPTLDESKLFKLAKDNGVDASAYRKDFKPENAGRIRMTIGNMIRGAASRNGKLVTLGGATKQVPVALLPVKKEKKPVEKKAKATKKEKQKKAA